ncbi:alkylated DNA repair protein (DNA oxidative demethylase) [Tranquillimonas rosea]|uniref:Alkylated DNA repair protein (DNA oxidative demethylase) n=1 Tax=Tranquillimonas rosea TaxID=641238 RepID=A0A1H9UJW4_9RHOB|nr:alpha-ketoglutarate-dependent dioxygenase AlkB [Tranquillimonas rosea]SES09323.1 alkylated DNA repair protein (DNA oxidative demethylase) [Tranquillimonas rosea]
MDLRNRVNLRGINVFREALDSGEQRGMLDDLREVIRAAPLVQPETARGRKMSVRMTAAGRLGWVSDRRGYRYESRHPSGVDWPPIPASVLAVWHAVTGNDRVPDCCLVNHYGEGARMGLHQDRDEGDFSWPVVSISLGDEGLFRVGNIERGGKTESLWLTSGDVLEMGGEARLVHHGVDRIRFGTSSLMPKGGRVNVTLRVVDHGETEQHPVK